MAGRALGISAKLSSARRGILLVVSLFVSQGGWSLHLLTLWEAQVESELYPRRCWEGEPGLEGT